LLTINLRVGGLDLIGRSYPHTTPQRIANRLLVYNFKTSQNV